MGIETYDKRRQLTPIGDNCISCTEECPWIPKGYKLDVYTSLKGKKKWLTLCTNPYAPIRGQEQPDIAQPAAKGRVCLLQQPNFDTTTKVEDIK